MPSIVHMTVTMTSVTHLVRDEVVNGFTFASVADNSISLAAAASDSLTLFYNDAPGTPLCASISSSIDRGTPVTVRAYELSNTSATTPIIRPQPGFGSPIQTTSFTLGAGGGGLMLPEQVACCISYHANRDQASEHSGPGPRPAERTRGRVYIGPFNTGALAQDPTTKGGVVSADLLTTMNFIATRLAANDPPTSDHRWVVWSRKDNLVRPIVGGFIDNEFDTQRRRAEEATFRSVWGIPAA